MNWRGRIATCFVVVTAMCGNADAEALRRENNPDKITLVVPAFFSEPPQLGLSVMTILQLQIWRTLRKEPDRNRNKLSFGDGEALWFAPHLQACPPTPGRVGACAAYPAARGP